ncbi:MAG: TolC family protein [Alphaproteobacteria bacterium]|nr:TolC family protein [Alphaproteobacteria bacterium]
MKTLRLALFLSTSLLLGCTAKPDLLTDDEINSFVARNAKGLVANQEPVSGRIGLYEAMARALKYNLDYKVEMMNTTLQARAADVKSAAMLPQVAGNWGYSGRDPNSGGYSRSLTTGLKSADASTSSQAQTFDANISASWNVLDFGLSYVRAKQAGDEALIAQESKRKVVNRIIEDVRTTYWRAASAERLLAGLNALEGRVNTALANSRSLSHEGALAPLTALTYQRELVDIRKQIHEMERDLKTAKLQLAALMNIPPSTNFSLAIPKRGAIALKLNQSAETLVETAMIHRPELHEALLKERISAKEASAALLELLPGISVYGGTNWDSNDLLYNSNWLSWGAKASWNVMRLFSYPAIKSSNEARAALTREQALAMTMAVFTQVHTARARFYHQAEILKDTNDFYNVQSRILNQVRASAATNASSEQALIREEMNTLLASIKYDVAYADLQNAFANVYASIGIDPFGEGVNGTESVDALATALRGVWIERGDRSGT